MTDAGEQRPSEPSTPEPTALEAAAVPARRRTALGVVGAVIAVVVACFVVAAIAAPDASDDVAVLQQRAQEACARAGGEEDACRCALDRLAAGGTALGALDEELVTPLSLPAEVVASIADCAVDTDAR